MSQANKTSNSSLDFGPVAEVRGRAAGFPVPRQWPETYPVSPPCPWPTLSLLKWKELPTGA